MKIFDGKSKAIELENQLQEYLKKHPCSKKLLIIQIGENEVSEKYIKLKEKLCNRLGIPVKEIYIPVEEEDSNIATIVTREFSDSEVGGGIIQLPLPRKSLNGVLDLIPVEKDLDFLSSEGKNIFTSGNFSKLPPVVRAVKLFLKETGMPKKVILLGHGVLVGQPLAFYLKSQNVSVEINLFYMPGSKLEADLVLLCTGIPGFVNPKDINENCNVIDFGSSIVEGHTTGDLNVTDKSALDHLGNVSLSPGGMGPLVVRFLIANLLKYPRV